jgi:hypothetical protein
LDDANDTGRNDDPLEDEAEDERLEITFSMEIRLWWGTDVAEGRIQLSTAAALDGGAPGLV